MATELPLFHQPGAGGAYPQSSLDDDAFLQQLLGPEVSLNMHGVALLQSFQMMC